MPQLTAEIRDEGLCLYALERYPEAADSLQQYLDLEPKAADRTKVWFLNADDLTSVLYLVLVRLTAGSSAVIAALGNLLLSGHPNFQV